MSRMKQQLLIVLTIIALPALFIISCTKNNSEQLKTPPGGGSTCDTVGMAYTKDILPILKSFCFSCHGNGNTGGSGGISLDSYNDIKDFAKNGTLDGVINHKSGYIGMPYNLAKLDECTINQIEDWIKQGSPNN
jgi:hypothetical protein